MPKAHFCLFWPGRHCLITHCLIALSLCLLAAQVAAAATYYVSPTGSSTLSSNAASPGSLSYAVANAPSGSTVILENGTYDATPNGFFVANSNVTFQAQNWHRAIIINSTGSNLWTSTGSSVNDDVMQGMVFGPSTGLGFSGGPNGGSGWQFLDCEFVQDGGFEFGNGGEFLHCLFTDDYSNSFDIGGSQSNPATGTIQDCIARRGNRASADDDGVGNKEDFTRDLLFNDFVAYDNNGAALWFDTDNDSWTIENSTFFGNHGGNNWYYCSVGSGTSTTQFTGYGEDGQGISVGQPIMCLTGTSANIGHISVVTAVSGYNPQTITISPALPATPSANDQIIVQQDGASGGDGFITEANDNGTFTNNWVYSNTDNGFFDHSSGGSTYGGTGGLIVTNNLFAYCGEGFFVWSDQRDQGPATVEYNQFKFLPGTTSAFDSWGSTPGAYPNQGGITFDYNDYNPDNSNGGWAVWYTSSPPPTAGGLTAGSQPAGQDYLQNPSTWNQDLHGNTSAVTLLGTAPSVYVWPASTDTNWSDVYFPNNAFGLSNSVHQIDDTNGAVNNTIDAALTSHGVGDLVTIPVAAHTPLLGTTCEVYDLNGRWVTLTVPTADQAAFLAAVPPYVTCATGNATVTYTIAITLNSTPPYNVTATYNPSGSGGTPPTPPSLTAVGGNQQITLSWTSSSGATSYNLYRSMTGGGEGVTPYITGLTTTSYVDSGLAAGTEYYYEATAVSSGNESAKSNEASAITIPPAPTGLSATSGYQQVSLTWNKATGAASYDVYRGTSPGGESLTPIAANVTSASFTDTGLTNGTMYYYEVAAVNASGTSSMSNEASALPTPPPPTGLTAAGGNHQIALSWVASAGATSYNVYRGTASGGEAAVPIAAGVTSTSYNDTGLTDGVAYYYKVAAVSGAAISAMSNEASAVPQAPVLHTFPSGLQMIAAPTDDSGISLSQIFSYSPITLAVWSNSQYVLSPTAPADTIRPGQGYWVRFSNATSLYDMGEDISPAQSYSISLSAGWNMIGVPFNASVLAGSLQIKSGANTYSFAQANSAGLVAGDLYTYQSGDTEYEILPAASTTLAPYEGYWIDAFSPVTLVFPAGN